MLLVVTALDVVTSTKRKDVMNETKFTTTQPLCQTNKSLCQTNKSLCQTHEPLCQTHEPLCQTHEPLCQTHKPQFRANLPGRGYRWSGGMLRSTHVMRGSHPHSPLETTTGVPAFQIAFWPSTPE